MAGTLQGLANRDKPQVFFLMEDHRQLLQWPESENWPGNINIDQWWLEELTEPGHFLADYTLINENNALYPPNETGFFALLDEFFKAGAAEAGFWNGFVLWDRDLPATSSVAKTAAGVENLLPIRKHTAPGSLYDRLILGTGAPYTAALVKLDLEGRFADGKSGSQTVLGTNFTSSGSAKNDAYLWAVEKYLKPGLTSTELMYYGIDAFTRPAPRARAEGGYMDDGDGKLIVVRGHYDETLGKVIIKTRHFSQYVIGYNYVTFADVPEGHPSYDDILFLAARGITAGVGSDRFGLDTVLTRVQLLVILMKAYGIEMDEEWDDNFEDAAGTWYEGWIATAKRLGMTAGIGNNQFGLDNSVTREQMLLLIYKTLEALGETLPVSADGKTLTDFTDADQLSDWAYLDGNDSKIEAVLMSGVYTGTLLDPQGDYSRAEIAGALRKMLKM